MSSFQRAMFLGGVPSLFMFVSTCIGLGREVPDDISGALQHFAAGVLLCTVGTELLPEIVDAEGWMENIAACIGFFLGVAVLILIGMFAPEETGLEPALGESPRHNEHKDENCANADDDVDDIFRLREMKFVIAGRKFRQRQTLRTFGGRFVLNRSMSLDSSLPAMDENEPLLFEDLSSSYMENRPSKPKDTAPKKEAREPMMMKQFPLSFVFAVAIDSALDGLLIGIASAAGPSAGPMMSASLSVEMSFLGITLATTLSGQPFSRASIAALVGPLCLVMAAGLGGMMADTLSHNPVAFVGMISFGASALLFMVAEELLLDAHEDGEHVWWVDLQLYTGFFASIIARKLAR
ncbi:expressed unknown protein [Seminavis robusta]|uniref:Uncharacterized protein n=1 Tax=Seminavis robusta TaxID=568900 RepID=A0A9N8EN73_9STRA|nr:expressed unknown protein [Seminavis robusta]|eukprot:Sro1507_g278380.1 n/a (351) ;mRNA; r:18697-19892